jgi:thiol-disulfide isomerase/thioredoxin/uncharacterized membrane protein YphA (DoxX/SURF4 family)
MHAALLVVRVLLAAVFGLAALTKLADRSGTRRATTEFGAPEALTPIFATLLPLAELAVAGALLVPQAARWGAVGAFVLLIAFIAAITRSMVRGEAPDCHCFGQLHSEPAGGRALARNVAFAGASGFVAVGGWHDAGPSAVAWIGRLDGAGAVALAGGLALAALAAAATWVTLMLLRQNGRLLVRLDELEQRIAQAGMPIPPPPSTEYGLPIGTEAPDFTLSGLYGETTTLEALVSADNPVLAVFTDPDCGPCNAMLPRIAGWQGDHAGALTIAVLTRGSAEDNRAKVREHGIVNVWLDPDQTVYDAFEVPGTPAAVLIDTQRRIASPTYGGAEAMAALVAEAVGRPFEIVRSGPAPPPSPSSPPVGAEAPVIELPDLTGARVGLRAEDRDTLVVFWNPGCGFCQAMLPELQAWEVDRPPGAPRLVLISSGSVQENESLGLGAPILLDEEFSAGASFGAAGTPSGLLVDSQGRIASDLAVGAEDVMALAEGDRNSSHPV